MDTNQKRTSLKGHQFRIVHGNELWMRSGSFYISYIARQGTQETTNDPNSELIYLVNTRIENIFEKQALAGM